MAPRVYVTYALPVLLALVVLFVFPVTKHIRRDVDRWKYWALQAVTFVGAMVGAKLAAFVGDTGWPLRATGVTLGDMLASGRSIVGGLLGGFVFAECAKPLFRYTLAPNDRFAAVLPFSLAVGRLGCHFTGCCLGLPHEGALSVRDASGVGRWPIPLMEMGFDVVVGLVFLRMVRAGALQGRLFSVFLVAYGTWRFATEFLRDTPKLLGPLSLYQAMAALMVLVGVTATWLRTPRAPQIA